jgi:hypothetical protein
MSGSGVSSSSSSASGFCEAEAMRATVETAQSSFGAVKHLMFGYLISEL